MVTNSVMTRLNTRLRPVKSYKHIIDTQGGLVANGQQNFSLIEAVDNPVLANRQEVETASTVSSIYLKVECYATGTAALANCYMAVMKNPGANLTPPSTNGIGITDEKKFVIHQEMVMLEKNSTGNPRTLFRGVIRIPRGYKRFGTKDLLQLSLKSIGTTADFCFQCIYKEFR